MKERFGVEARQHPDTTGTIADTIAERLRGEFACQLFLGSFQLGL